MSANDPIGALLAHLNSEHGRKALALLVGRGSLEKRALAFAKELGLAHGSPGRRAEELGAYGASNRWRAVLALRAFTAVAKGKKRTTLDDSRQEAVLRRVAAIFGVAPTDLSKWSKDHRRLKHKASDEQEDDAREACERYIADALAHYELHRAAFGSSEGTSSREQ
jgi:hypothetical protein